MNVSSFNFILIAQLLITSIPDVHGSETDTVEEDRDFGCRWVDTLNFTINLGNSADQENQQVSSDNIPLFSSVKLPGDLSMMDVDELHNYLMTEEHKVHQNLKGDKNIVVAALSLLIEDNHHINCLYYPMHQVFISGASVSGAAGDKKDKPRRYIDAAVYNPSDLVRAFQDRFKLPQGESSSCNNNVEDPYRRAVEKVIIPAGNAWIQSVEEELRGEYANIFSELYSYFEGVISEEDQEKRIQDLLDFPQHVMDLSKKAKKALNLPLTSFWHSEQFLIHYLRENLFKPEGNSGLIIDARAKYVKAQKDNAKKLLVKIIDETFENKGKESGEWEEALTEPIKRYKEQNETIIGCILHIHSTRELCCCCAASLAAEMRMEFYIDKIKAGAGLEGNTTEPFFTVLASCEKKMDKTSLVPGIKTEQKNGAHIDMGVMLANQWFPQLHLTG